MSGAKALPRPPSTSSRDFDRTPPLAAHANLHSPRAAITIPWPRSSGCSIDHARFAAAWLAERGVRVASVFAAPGSADRSAAVTQLLRGELDALCVVDIFNEGVDLPALDRVVMLRPTESAVVFLQQIDRGLRRHDGKERLTVIDFVGNHRVFLDRLRRLLSLVSALPPQTENEQGPCEGASHAADFTFTPQRTALPTDVWRSPDASWRTAPLGLGGPGAHLNNGAVARELR